MREGETSSHGVDLGALDDRELLARGVAGDRRAIGELYRRLAPRLEGIAGWGNISYEDRQDAVGETFFELMRNVGSLREGSEPMAWLTTVVRNKLRDIYWRRRRQFPPVADVDPDGSRQRVQAAPGNLHEMVVDTVMNEKRREVIEGALNAVLPDIEPAGKPGRKSNVTNAQVRAILLLHYVEGFKQVEIAPVLGISDDALKTRLANVREKMKEWILKNFPDFEEGRWK